jgi:hypothetical protein
VRLASAVLAVSLFGASHASGQTSAAGAPIAAKPAQPAPEPEEAVEWTFAAALYVYQVPDDSNYAQPTVTADRDWLHLEARYNYEDLETGSLWMGYNFGGGETVAWELTPMLGGLFGITDAIAPAYKGSFSWRRLAFYSEGEYVFDTDSSERFFYNWSELTLAPVEWWRIGLVTQRTRVYATERDIQRGLLVGLTHKALDSAIYVFNPDDSQPIVVFSVTVGF